MKKITLLLDQDSITRLTAVSFNTDLDRFLPYVRMTQTTDIVRILTKPLYDKIVADFEADTLTGEYETIYNEFVVDILVYLSSATYLKLGIASVGNGGITLAQPENQISLTLPEIEKMAEQYSRLGSAIELEFTKYMKTISIPEYPSCTPPSSFGMNWKFGGSTRPISNPNYL